MDAASVRAFLAGLEPLPYSARCREVVLLAKRLSGGTDLAGLLRELDAGGPDERYLGVLVAVVAGDVAHLLALLRDPDPRFRCRVLAAGGGLIPDQALRDVLDDAPAQVRAAAYRVIRSGRRTELAEALIEPVRGRWGDEEAAALLAVCRPETAARLLLELAHAVRNWGTLGRAHPGVVLAEAERQLSVLPEPMWPQWWQRYGAGVGAVCGTDPAAGLDLLERFGPAVLPAPVLDQMSALVGADPGRVVRLLIAPARRGQLRHAVTRRKALVRRLVRQDPAELVELGRALWEDGDSAVVPLLAAMPPARREAFFDAVTAGQDLSQRVLSDAVLNALPRWRRHREATRMLALAPVREDTWSRLRVLSYLPLAEAGEGLRAETRRSDAGERARAYGLLIACAARSADATAFAGVLDGLTRLRNEQDPVRSPVVAALTGVPPALFQDPCLDALEQITLDAIEARDCSWNTRSALAHLAVRLLGQQASTPDSRLVAWALRTLERLSRAVGSYDLARLDLLRRGQEHQVVAVLRPHLEDQAARGRYDLLFTVFQSLGRRAWSVPDLQPLLAAAVDRGNDSTVRRAVGYWLQDPATRDVRVEQVLAGDRSAIALPPVLDAVARRRTDLLDSVLTGSPPVGRFLSQGVRWVPLVATGLHRWLPRQRRDYGRLLTRLARDAGAAGWERASAIGCLARIPGSGTEELTRFAGADDVVLAEAALAALAWTDRPDEVLPVLLAHAGDDRARVAMYAAGRCARYVAPSRLGPALAGVLRSDTKVTSRKEAVRLAARLAVPDAGSLLLETYGRTGQHRDVRAACVAAATLRLDDLRGWTILETAAAGARDLTLPVLHQHPFDLPERHRPRYGRLVAGLCTNPDPEIATEALARFEPWATWAPEGIDAVVAAVCDLSTRATWRAAAATLQDLLRAAAGADRLGPVIESLTRADAAPDAPDAGLDRDRPARQRLDRIVAGLTGWSRRDPIGARATLEVAADRLRDVPGYAGAAVRCHAHSARLQAQDPQEVLRDLAQLADLVAHSCAQAVLAGEVLAARLASFEQPWSVGVLGDVARRLAARGDHPGGLFGLVLTSAGGRRTGWAEPWPERLRQLRGHVDADIREAALSTYTAQE